MVQLSLVVTRQTDERRNDSSDPGFRPERYLRAVGDGGTFRESAEEVA